MVMNSISRYQEHIKITYIVNSLSLLNNLRISAVNSQENVHPHSLESLLKITLT